MSRMYMAGTLRSWVHYCQLRTNKYIDKDGKLVIGTQKEHYDISLACWREIEKEFPSLSLYVSMYGDNSGRVTFRRKGDVAMPLFEEVIAFIEKQGFKVDRGQSDNEYDYDDDRYWLPRIEFKKSDNAKNF